MRRAWQALLGFFVLSGLTGVLYRSGIAYGETLGFDLVNIRHAHSHTMYFGWATPALILMVGLRVGVSKLKPIMCWLFGAAAIAYPLFLLFGYRPVAIGSARMPISVIAATLNTLIWYAFAAYYFRDREGAGASSSNRLWDTSLAFLILATLGAFGLALLKPLGLQDPVWSVALTHVFLDLFSEGWFVLAVLGLAYANLGDEPAPLFGPALAAVTIGLPFTFAMGMPLSLVAGSLEIASRIGSLLVGAGLVILAGLLWNASNRQPWWRLPLALLMLKGLGQVVAALAVGFWFADYHGLRILYLHLMLLGFVSMGLVAAARSALGLVDERGIRVYYGAVLILLLSLIPLSEAVAGGRWAFQLAMWIGLLPVAAAVYLIAQAQRYVNSARTSSRVPTQIE